jgi:hypothetical protein
LVASLLICCAVRAADTGASAPRQDNYVQLVLRLRSLTSKEKAFGADYQPIYHAALPWYELWDAATGIPSIRT